MPNKTLTANLEELNALHRKFRADFETVHFHDRAKLNPARTFNIVPTGLAKFSLSADPKVSSNKSTFFGDRTRDNRSTPAATFDSGVTKKRFDK